jgi:hypothetical protein
LLGDDGLIGGAIEVGLHDAVRPEDARHVDSRAGAEAKMGGRAGQHLFLREQPRPDFDFAADAKRVDPLIPCRWLRNLCSASSY